MIKMDEIRGDKERGRRPTTRRPHNQTTKLTKEIAILIFLGTITARQAWALLDFLGEQSKKAVEAAAYADAVTELAGEISPSTELKEGATDLNRRAEKLRSQASELRYLSRTTKNVLTGPDWSSRRLETNIRSTTDYVRRIKSLISRITILGTDGATALNTTETNIALNEVQKNQQALLLQNEDTKLRGMEKEQEEAKSWSEFSKSQRQVRSSEAKSGKLL